jgi:hypothetical protein
VDAVAVVALRSLRLALIVLASVVLGAVLLVPILFVAAVPTTFRCRTFMDASAEAKLVYPGGRLLSYESREGSRQLIEMSSPPGPAFFSFQAVPSGDHGEFLWFDDQLQRLGWRPLNPESRFQVVQSSGDTMRGGGEAISIMRFESGRIPPGVGPEPPDGHALLRYSYFVIDNAAVPECR